MANIMEQHDHDYDESKLLRQQLADAQAREVKLRDALKFISEKSIVPPPLLEQQSGIISFTPPQAMR